MLDVLLKLHHLIIESVHILIQISVLHFQVFVFGLKLLLFVVVDAHGRVKFIESFGPEPGSDSSS